MKKGIDLKLSAIEVKLAALFCFYFVLYLTEHSYFVTYLLFADR
jgi:hypothetical protein